MAFGFADLSSAAGAEDADKLADAAEVLHTFTVDEESGIPTQLLERARGIAVIPNLIRGGFIVGGRRGRGVLTVRAENGAWSNPAFITLTGGSIGWQLGAESADVVLVFANDRSIKNIEGGKFTLGGDATAVAGPLGRRSTKAVTARSEVYIYVRSRGLFAGAAVEGARLDIDQDASAAFYSGDMRPLEPQGYGTPESARRFLTALSNASLAVGAPALSQSPSPDRNSPAAQDEGAAIIYPLE
jgi:lipid-binding SYLF domain-containing protein